MINFVNELREQKGSKAKKAYLTDLMNSNELFKNLIQYMYNTKYSYYLSEEIFNKGLEDRKFDPPYEGVFRNLQEVFVILDALRTREISGHQGLNIVVEYAMQLSEGDREFLKLIFARSLKSGLDVKSILECSPGLVPYTPYMRCDLLNEKTINNLKIVENEGAYAQLKADGEFVNCVVDVNAEGHLEFTYISRDGFIKENIRSVNIDTRLELIYRHYQRPIVVMGELLIHGINDRAVSNGIFNRLDIDPELMENVFILIWDVIPLEDWENKKYAVDYSERLASLTDAGIQELSLMDVAKKLHPNFTNDSATNLGVYLIPTLLCNSMNEIFDFYSQCLQLGLEGSIAKSKINHFKDGTSTEQLKIKIAFEVDLIITGFSPGTGKNAKLFGSIEIQSSDGLLKTKCSGMKDSVRKEMHNNRAAYLGKILKVEANDCYKSENSPHYVLSHCRYKTIRDDKDVADSLEKVLSELNAKRFLQN